MTDDLSEADVKRVDQHVDPTAVNRDDIQSSLNDDFEGSAREAFAEALEQQREPVRQEARELLSKRVTTNPANNQAQLRTEKGHFGPQASDVSGTYVSDSGDVYAQVRGGDNVRLGSVNLDAGADGSRDAAYSR